MQSPVVSGAPARPAGIGDIRLPADGRPRRMRARLLAAALGVLLPLAASAGEKRTIGAVEEVILLPWGIRLSARVDTGARASSLDARQIRVAGREVEVNLAPGQGGEKIRLPILRWRTVKTSEGKSLRPVVRLEVCLGLERMAAEVNVSDRSDLEHPFLIGRDLLRGRFVVDVDRRWSLPPQCPQ
ncbi:MAG: ATP-dependent zinc protease [Candidatus Tectomicrobia bacterium]|nr:ATP-dependent zinc protease [Candidatus Tectomicrobia bacterium]